MHFIFSQSSPLLCPATARSRSIHRSTSTVHRVAGITPQVPPSSSSLPYNPCKPGHSTLFASGPKGSTVATSNAGDDDNEKENTNFWGKLNPLPRIKKVFVGKGAQRVRKTFARAAKMSPCIIFIDELDALGKSRSMGGLGAGLRSNDEAEQTLNQLLACMDVLDSSRGVCVMAATNRKETLDPALVRPGRFDRIIKVDLPDTNGRESILRVHAKKLPGFTESKGIDEKRTGSLGKGVAIDLSAVAAVTNGLCGAELEFIVNEAAIRAVRRVSSKLRDGVDPTTVKAQVTAIDFEDSLRNYYSTRKPSGSGAGVGQSLINALQGNS